MSDLNPLDKVRLFFRDHQPVSAGQTLVVAVSGGPDSVCLLHVLHGLKEELGIRLHVAHLNHQLRGGESDADAVYVSNLAGNLGLPATIAARDAAAYQTEHRLSPEEAAREVRYAFLSETAGETGAPAVAVGHTADDQAETVLMNLLRGTGTRGLRGLQPVSRRQSAAGNFTIIRPLLEFTRKETVAYCRDHDLEPRLDATNLSEEPFRNRVRHRLLPILGEYNPQITEVLLRTARIAGDDIDFIDGEVERRRDAITRNEKGAVVIDKEAFAALPAAMKRHLLRAVVLTLRGTLKDIEAGHIEDVLDALEKPAGKVIGLPDGLNFSIEYDRYVVGPDPAALCPLPGLEGEHHLKVPGITYLPGWEITATVYPSARVGDMNDTTGGFTAWFNYAVTGSNLTVRARRPGDRFRPLGMGKAKKLNQFMIDDRIPRTWRKRVPVVTSPEHILWVAGWRIDDRAKVTGDTGEVLRLRFTRV